MKTGKQLANSLPLHRTICIGKSPATLKNKNLRILKHFKQNKISKTEVFFDFFFHSALKAKKRNKNQQSSETKKFIELFIHV